MGEPPSQPASIIHHFSHPHPLQLSHSHSPVRLFPVICSCCNQTVSGWIYACNSCKYFIHVSCYQMPQNITHPFDQNHVPIQSPQAQHYPASPTPAVPMHQSTGNPIVQAPQAQHYPTPLTPAVPVDQYTGNPLALCPPYTSMGPPPAFVPRPPMQYHVPNNTVNLVGPVAFGSGLLGMIGPSVIAGACQNLGQSLMQAFLDGNFLGS